MCHSVEMYMPKITHDVTEHRVGIADWAAAQRERAAMDRLADVVTWMGRFFRSGATILTNGGPK